MESTNELKNIFPSSGRVTKRMTMQPWLTGKDLNGYEFVGWESQT